MSRFAQRRDQLRKLLKKSGAAALLVTNFTNVTYLTGFTGDDSFLLVTPDTEVLITDFRYTQQLEEECPGLPIEVRSTGTEMADAVAKVVQATKVANLGIEGNSMTVGFCTKLTEKLERTKILSTTGLVEELRMIKDKEEVQEIREAIEFAERAFGVVRASITPEQTEKEIAYELENQIRRFGGSRCSFTPIVGVGPRGALPHATLSDHRIADADFVLIDWGGKGRLYVSDLTRVLVTDKISPKLLRVYEVVLKANLAGIKAIKPGAVMQDVDAAARKVIEDAGFGSKFGHSLGHGIGLQVHEAPRLATKQDGKLRPGMVVTVEPGIYLPGWGGVRIEDDVLVTRTGHEVLTSVPKQLEDCVVN